MAHTTSTYNRFTALPFIFLYFSAAIFLGLAASVLPYWFFIILIIALGMLGVSIFKPIWAVLFLLVFDSGLIPERFTPNLPFLGGSIHAVDFFLAVLIVLTGTGLFLTKRTAIEFNNSLTKPLFFFLTLTILSTIIGLLYFSNSVRYVAYELRVCVYWVYGFIIAAELKNQKSITNTMRFITGLSFVLAIAVILQSITGWQILSGARVENLDTVGQVTSDISRSTFGGYQNFVVLSMVWLLTSLSTKQIKARYAIPLLLTLAVGLLVTFGRGVWAASFICVMIASAWLGWKHLIKISATGLIIIFSVTAIIAIARPTLIELVYNRITSVGRELQGGESWRWRQGENDYAIKKIKKYPITGIGLGGEYQPIRNRFMSPEQTRMMHNSYLYLILKFGVLGIIFPIWLCLALLTKSKALSNTEKPTTDSVLAISIGSALFMPIITGVTQPEWMEHKGVIFTATLFGILLALDCYKKSGAQRNTSA